jgi:TetR/AcrR family tetracycline transcriptional repressor
VDAEAITAAALEVLDDLGLDRLSMRAVAGRLRVHVGGLYYYLPDKSALLRSVTNEVCRQALNEFETTAMPGSAADLCVCVRRVLLGHRDSARVLAAGPLSGSVGALALMSRLVGLLDPAVSPSFANVAGDTLMSYITGYVLQEQIQSNMQQLPALPAELATQFPLLFRGIGPTDDDVMFDVAIAAIITGFIEASGSSRR